MLKLGNNNARSVRDLPGNPGLPGLRLGDNALRTVRTLAGPWTFGGYANFASLTTALGSANDDITWTANTGGTAGNSIRVRYVVAGASTPLSVSVSGSDITVNSATSAGSAATSTAAQVIAAVAASSAAGQLITGKNAPSNDGTGVIAALAFTNLTGGTDWVVGRG